MNYRILIMKTNKEMKRKDKVIRAKKSSKKHSEMKTITEDPESVNETSTSSFGTSGRSNHDSSKFYNTKLYSSLHEFKESDENKIPDEFINKIIVSSSENMKELPDNSIHLMITSPPYNVTKEYDEDLSLFEYLSLLKNVLRETFRVLVVGGRVCINVANVGRKPYIPLSDYISKFMLNLGFLMRGEIIWDKAASSGSSTAWGSWKSASNPVLRDVHEYILIFAKGDYKRDSKGKVNTITSEQFTEWTKSIWTMNTESAKKIGHPAPFPIELPHRLIQLYSFKDDVILDPFCGSGTTCLSALMDNRKYVGYDNNENYVKIAEKRISDYLYEKNIPRLKL